MRYFLCLLALSCAGLIQPVSAQALANGAITGAQCTEVAPVVCAPTSSTSPEVVLQREDARVLAGFGYTVSSSIVAISSGNYLNAILSNPSNSGVTLVMSSRLLNCNLAGGNTPNEYARYVSGATFPATPTPTTVAIGNRRAGGAVSSATFQYQMASATLVGTTSAGGFVPTGGNRLEIKEIVLIPPGSSLAYTIGGAGGGLAATARCAVTFLFYSLPA